MCPLCYSVVRHSSPLPALILGYLHQLRIEVEEVEAKPSDLYSVLCGALAPATAFSRLPAEAILRLIHHTHKETGAWRWWLAPDSGPHALLLHPSPLPQTLIRSIPVPLLPTSPCVLQPSAPRPHAPSSPKPFALASLPAWNTLPLGNPKQLLG